ncbi:MAG TPA: MbcA/ParS/Xre antitoxin family protein [Steroidobacter sp.]
MTEALLWHSVQHWSNLSITPLEDFAMFQPRSLEHAGFDPDELGSAALTAFFNITSAWQLGAEEERVLLGSPPRSTFFKWKSERSARLSPDTLERISYVMGIYKALHILLPTQEMADGWVKKPNRAHGFGGKSALEKMLAGRVVDLADVRRYLDAQRG